MLRLLEDPSDPFLAATGLAQASAGDGDAVVDLSVEPVDYDAILQRMQEAEIVQVW